MSTLPRVAFSVHHVLPILALVLCAVPAAAQSLGALDVTEGTLGTVVRVEAAGLSGKPSLALVQDGAKVKKTKLKLRSVAPDAVEVEVRKAPAGSYQIGLVKKKDVLDVADDTFTVSPPVVDGVTPDTAVAKDEVQVTAAFADTKGVSLLVGGKKAKLLELAPVTTEGGPPLDRFTIRVPGLPEGIWPVEVVNPVGRGALPAAVTLVDSSKGLGKPSIDVELSTGERFKARKKRVVAEAEETTLTVRGLDGSAKKPRNLTVTVPLSPGDFSLLPGDAFGPADEQAEITYSEADKGPITLWVPDDEAGWEISVAARDGARVVLFVRGTLERFVGTAEPESLEISGYLVTP